MHGLKHNETFTQPFKCVTKLCQTNNTRLMGNELGIGFISHTLFKPVPQAQYGIQIIKNFGAVAKIKTSTDTQILARPEHVRALQHPLDTIAASPVRFTSIGIARTHNPVKGFGVQNYAKTSVFVKEITGISYTGTKRGADYVNTKLAIINQFNPQSQIWNQLKSSIENSQTVFSFKGNQKWKPTEFIFTQDKCVDKPILENAKEIFIEAGFNSSQVDFGSAINLFSDKEAWAIAIAADIAVRLPHQDGGINFTAKEWMGLQSKIQKGEFNHLSPDALRTEIKKSLHNFYELMHRPESTFIRQQLDDYGVSFTEFDSCMKSIGIPINTRISMSGMGIYKNKPPVDVD